MEVMNRRIHVVRLVLKTILGTIQRRQKQSIYSFILNQQLFCLLCVCVCAFARAGWFPYLVIGVVFDNFLVVFFTAWHGVCTSDKNCSVNKAICDKPNSEPDSVGVCKCRAGRRYLSRMCLGK